MLSSLLLQAIQINETINNADAIFNDENLIMVVCMAILFSEIVY